MSSSQGCTTRTTAAILSSFSSCGFGSGGGPSVRHTWQIQVVAPISGVPPSAFLAQQPGPTPQLHSSHVMRRFGRRSQLHRQRHSTDSNGSGVDIEASTVVLACPSSRRRSIHQKSMLIIRTAKVIAATSAAEEAPAAPGSVMSTVEPRQLRRTISSVSQSLLLLLLLLPLQGHAGGHYPGLRWCEREAFTHQRGWPIPPLIERQAHRTVPSTRDRGPLNDLKRTQVRRMRPAARPC